MRRGAAALAFVFVTACASTSEAFFNATKDHEEGDDIPCRLNGAFVTGWHACRAAPADACCPNGYSCSLDDFVPSLPPNVCRWWGRN